MTLEDFFLRFGVSFSQGTLWALMLALPAGLVASAVCPCTLPVGLGVAGVVGSSEGKTPKGGVGIALSFFAGIVINLTLLGAVAGRLGAMLTESFGQYWSVTMAAVSLVAAGAAFWGPRLRVKRLASLRRPGMIGAFSYGFLFSLGTSAAPLLLLLAAALAKGNLIYGIFLAFVFGLGRGLPFLLIGLFSGTLARLTSLGQFRWTLQIVSGLGLLVVSVYYFRVFVALL
jgi:cytochrome c-type biogenesis protein